MSWITEQKQTEVNKKTRKYLGKHYTLKLMAVSLLILDGMKELSVKKKYILKSIFPFLFITFALDNV